MNKIYSKIVKLSWYNSVVASSEVSVSSKKKRKTPADISDSESELDDDEEEQEEEQEENMTGMYDSRVYSCSF